MEKKSTRLNSGREVRTKELPLKQRVSNYIDLNRDISKSAIAKHFGISNEEVSIILSKIGKKLK